MYEELKERIEGLENGWDKKADDLLQVILKTGNNRCTYAITIHCENEMSGTKIVKVVDFLNGNQIHAEFAYATQCQKMDAFKAAFLWFLNNSDIKKDDKTEKIKEIREQIKALERKIDDVEKTN